MAAQKRSQMNSKPLQQGFTLLEVLVAMAIVAIGLSAVFMQVSQMVSTSIYLQQKTLATWVAADRITEVRILDELPAAKTTEDEIEMAGITWGYTLQVSKPFPDLENLRRIDVDVYFADDPDTVIGSATGFRGSVMKRESKPVIPGTGAPIGESQEGIFQ
jgi:general secretion pathway protein I